MKRHLRILLAGAVVVVPFAVTVWLAIGVSTWLDNLAREPLKQWGVPVWPGVGALLVLAALYFIGLLTQFWIFRGLIGLLERLVERLPGVKTIYESVRDLLKLFGGDANRMGRVVLYTPPDEAHVTMLAILTNDQPRGLEGEGKVAIFLPYSYMFGGITIYVPASCLTEVAMPVEEALKLCATAQVASPELILDDSDEQSDGEQVLPDQP